MNKPSLFATTWENDGGKSIAAVQQKLASAQPKPSVDVAVGVGEGKVIGLPIGKSPWTFAHALDARPTAVGSVVVASGGGETFALDATSGKLLWKRPSGGMSLRGAGDDGSVTVVSLAQASGSVLLAVDREGSVVRQLETSQVLGVPAVLAGHAFVPWAGQYLSVIDLVSGDEAGRALLREKASRAWTVGGALYFGEVGIARFDENIKLASENKTTHIAVPAREFPGNPTMLRPGDEALKPTANAIDKVRLWARPASPSGPLAYDAGRFYATYFRIVMGFDTQKNNLAWIQSRPSDVLAAAAGPGSLVVCDEQGNVVAYDAATGGEIYSASLGEPIKSCDVQVDGWKAQAAPKPVPPLAEQIAPAILNRDSEMATGQRLLLRELAQLEDEAATKTLIELAVTPQTVPVLVEDARLQIAGRKNGQKYMLDALDRHYDFLKDQTRSPPVGPIAQALGNMKLKGASAALASHLLDPNDTEDDVKRAAQALVYLAEPADTPQLKQFFVMYRASAESDEVQAAVAFVGEALLNAGGAEGRKVVDAALADPTTLTNVKARLATVVQAYDASRSAGKDVKPPKK